MMRLSFFGAAGTVTGSRFLLSNDGTRVLVDCGLFQGLKVLRLRNWNEFPVDPAALDAIVLTHAHLDHSGFLPVLVRDGFRGPIHCTPPTDELARILLADSGRLQEEDARYANRKGFSKHKPALPLYTEEDAARVTERFVTHGFGEEFNSNGARFRFFASGHILGAASIHVQLDGLSLTFSGDIGRPADPLIPAPVAPPPSDVVVMESTYGDRLHGDHDPSSILAGAVSRTVARGGVVMVPAFAVGRAQTVLYLLHQLFEEKRLPRVPVYLNSPMALDVVELFTRHAAYHRLSPAQTAAALRDFESVRSVDESKELNRQRGPMVIVAGSGMMTGGRILHHLRAFGGDHRNTILLTGYQAAGTRGADLLAGARSLRIHGADVPIRAEVVRLDGLSAHADQEELLSWIGAVAPRPRHVHLVHGEPEAADTLRRRIETTLSVPASAAEHLASVNLSVSQRASAP